MELKTFISGTLTQIVEGVVEAQKNTDSLGAIVCPPVYELIKDGVKTRNYNRSDNNDQPVSDIDFDVAVTIGQDTETKGGVGILMANIVLGTQGKTENKNTAVHRIKFSINLLLPIPKK